MYTWSNVQPGSYAYHSGTHPAVQVQMGLYGALTKDAALGQVYSGVTYDNEVMLYYSEIDPALHAAVAADDYGPGKGTTSTIDYQPKYFLVNGKPYTDKASATISAGNTGERTLLRMFNMGLRPHTPVLQGLRLQLVAEDGKPYSYARDQHSAFLAAGKTKDAIIAPSTQGTYAVFDRFLNLSNADATPGGMLSFLDIGQGIPPGADTVTILRTRHDNNFGQLGVWADSSASPIAVLSVTGFGLMQSFPNNGDFNYRLLASAVGNPGSVTATSDQGGSDTKQVPYTAPPVAVDDAFSTSEDNVLSIPAPGLLANDSKGGWFEASEALRPAIVTNPTSGSVRVNGDGSIFYVPNRNFNGTDSFTYQANAIDINTSTVLDSSDTATVTLTISAVNDAPVGIHDAYEVEANTTLSVAAPGVLQNDTDVDGDALSAVLVSGTSNGLLNFNSDGSFDYTPNPGTVSDSFIYVANDGNLDSLQTTVNITVIGTTPNEPPLAQNDLALTTINTAITFSVTTNDTDVDGTIDVTSVVIVQPPANGSVVPNGDGTVTYTPNLNFRGLDIFNYTVNDNGGATSNSAMVRVIIR
jgi:hypothetical protein